MRVRKIIHKVAIFSDIMLGIFGIITGALVFFVGVLIFPIIIFVFTIPLVLGLLIGGALSIAFGVLRIVLGVLAFRGGKVSYWILTTMVFLNFLLSIINLILRWDESKENIIGLFVPIIYGLLFVMHLAGTVVVSPKFCRRYRPLCFVRRVS